MHISGRSMREKWTAFFVNVNSSLEIQKLALDTTSYIHTYLIVSHVKYAVRVLLALIS